MASKAQVTESSTAESVRAGDGDRLLNVRLLQPSDDPSHALVLVAIPESTTVRELRNRIRTASPLFPVPERQRLIFQGHLLRDENATLSNVFGQSAVGSSTYPMVKNDAHIHIR